MCVKIEVELNFKWDFEGVIVIINRNVRIWMNKAYLLYVGICDFKYNVSNNKVIIMNFVFC